VPRAGRAPLPTGPLQCQCQRSKASSGHKYLECVVQAAPTRSATEEGTSSGVQEGGANKGGLSQVCKYVAHGAFFSSWQPETGIRDSGRTPGCHRYLLVVCILTFGLGGAATYDSDTGTILTFALLCHWHTT
jgi:hypothetical protein